MMKCWVALLSALLIAGPVEARRPRGFVTGSGSGPAAPTQVTGIPGNNSVSLLWAASSGATSYNVLRSTTSGSGYSYIGNTSTTPYHDTTAVNGTTYYYVVAAVNGSSTGPNSAQVGGYKPNSITQGTWVNITPPATLALTYGTTHFAIDPNDATHQTIYQTADGGEGGGAPSGGLWKSTNGGSSWTLLGTPPATVPSSANGYTTPYLDAPFDIAVDPNNANHLVATQGVRGTSLGFWVSTNGGASWTMPMGFVNVSQNNPANNDCTQMDIDQSNFNHIILSNHSPWSGYNSSGTLETTDGGNTWNATYPPSAWTNNTHSLNFLYRPAQGIGNAQTWLVADQLAGIWRTTNSGATWTQVSSTYNGIHNGNPIWYDLAGNIYAGSVPYPTTSPDNGITWNQVNTSGLSYSNYYAITGDGNVIYTMQSVAVTTGLGYNAPYVTTPEATGPTSAWTAYQSSAQEFSNGPFSLVYDPLNGLMYGSMWEAGLWVLRVIAP